MRTAFVLGGGGGLGAHEVGMLKALFEVDIRPDLVVGTSIGALNGAFISADPTIGAVRRLTDVWIEAASQDLFDDSVVDQLRRFARSGTHVRSSEPLRQLVVDHLPVERIEELSVPFQCVAASIEKSTARYFDRGPIADAVVASATVPGMFPPKEIEGEHFLDGGLVASIPLDRALGLGAEEVYVLQVGRIEESLVVPDKPWEVAMVAFEISRRHRFLEALKSVPEDVVVHVLPTGDPKSFKDLRQYRTANEYMVRARIEQSYVATSEYLGKVRA